MGVEASGFGTGGYVAGNPLPYGTQIGQLTVTDLGSGPSIHPVAAGETLFLDAAANAHLNLGGVSQTFIGDNDPASNNRLHTFNTIAGDGSGQFIGTAVLAGGTVVVATPWVKNTSIIILTAQADGANPGFLEVFSRIAGTSFTIKSSNALDTRTVGFVIFEP